MKKSFRASVARTLSLLALIGIWSSAHAAASTNGGFNSQSIESFAGFFIGLINTVIVPVVFAIAFLVFLWGVFTYFIAGGANEEKRQEGTKFVFSAIIGFVIMVSIWGLVNLAGSLLPGMDNNRPPLPTFGPAETAPAGASTNTINAGGGANATSGSKNLGDSCSATNGCGDGLSCVSGSCRPYGETIAPVACPSGNCIPGTNIPANLEGLY